MARERLVAAALGDGSKWWNVPQVACSAELAGRAADRVLAQMEQRGWVESKALEPPSSRRSRTPRAYRITEMGAQGVRRLAAGSAEAVR